MGVEVSPLDITDWRCIAKRRLAGGIRLDIAYISVVE